MHEEIEFEELSDEDIERVIKLLEEMIHGDAAEIVAEIYREDSKKRIVLKRG